MTAFTLTPAGTTLKVTATNATKLRRLLATEQLDLVVRQLRMQAVTVEPTDLCLSQRPSLDTVFSLQGSRRLVRLRPAESPGSWEFRSRWLRRSLTGVALARYLTR